MLAGQLEHAPSVEQSKVPTHTAIPEPSKDTAPPAMPIDADSKSKASTTERMESKYVLPSVPPSVNEEDADPEIIAANAELVRLREEHTKNLKDAMKTALKTAKLKKIKEQMEAEKQAFQLKLQDIQSGKNAGF